MKPCTCQCTHNDVAAHGTSHLKTHTQRFRCTVGTLVAQLAAAQVHQTMHPTAWDLRQHSVQSSGPWSVCTALLPGPLPSLISAQIIPWCLGQTVERACHSPTRPLLPDTFCHRTSKGDCSLPAANQARCSCRRMQARPCAQNPAFLCLAAARPVADMMQLECTAASPAGAVATYSPAIAPVRQPC